MVKIHYTSHNWLIAKINNEILRAHLHLLRGRVIDLGCGLSPYKEDILTVASSYVGVDWEHSPHGLSRVDVLADLSERLHFDAEHADTVVSFQAIEHLKNPDLFLSECFRILRPGGLLLLTSPFMWHVHEAPHDYLRLTRYGLEHLLRQTGFVEIDIRENTGFWQMWALKFNYHTARFARGPVRYALIPLWWAGQALSPLLDHYNANRDETASYSVLARKPSPMK